MALCDTIKSLDKFFGTEQDSLREYRQMLERVYDSEAISYLGVPTSDPAFRRTLKKELGALYELVEEEKIRHPRKEGPAPTIRNILHRLSRSIYNQRLELDIISSEEWENGERRNLTKYFDMSIKIYSELKKAS